MSIRIVEKINTTLRTTMRTLESMMMTMMKKRYKILINQAEWEVTTDPYNKYQASNF